MMAHEHHSLFDLHETNHSQQDSREMDRYLLHSDSVGQRPTAFALLQSQFQAQTQMAVWFAQSLSTQPNWRTLLRLTTSRMPGESRSLPIWRAPVAPIPL